MKQNFQLAAYSRAGWSFIEKSSPPLSYGVIKKSLRSARRCGILRFVLV
jgi:hypothetical protein